MAKIDQIIEQLSAGFQNPQVSFSFVVVEDQYMEQLQVRRKVAAQTHHKLAALSVGEMGGTMATFYGHKLSDCIKKAQTWRGLPTKTKRGPRQNGQPEPQAQS